MQSKTVNVKEVVRNAYIAPAPDNAGEIAAGHWFGTKVANEVDSALNEGQQVILDFEGVTFSDASFAGCILSKVMRQGAMDRFVVVNYPPENDAWAFAEHAMAKIWRGDAKQQSAPFIIECRPTKK